MGEAYDPELPTSDPEEFRVFLWLHISFLFYLGKAGAVGCSSSYNQLHETSSFTEEVFLVFYDHLIFVKF